MNSPRFLRNWLEEQCDKNQHLENEEIWSNEINKSIIKWAA